MKLVIFDLDETLVNFFAVHDKAFALTLEELFGIKGASYKHIDYAGKRIPDSIAEYARKEGVTPQVIAKSLESAERIYELNFARLMRNTLFETNSERTAPAQNESWLRSFPICIGREGPFMRMWSITL